MSSSSGRWSVHHLNINTHVAGEVNVWLSCFSYIALVKANPMTMPIFKEVGKIILPRTWKEGNKNTGKARGSLK